MNAIINQKGNQVTRSGLENYRRRVSATKRRSILDAARSEFQTCGFTRAAMAEVARKADVSTATLYKHFNSKEELFSAVITEAYSQIGMEEAETGGNAEETLTIFSQNYIDSQYSMGLNALTRAVLSEVSVQPELSREFFLHNVEKRYTELANLISGLIERGLLRHHNTLLSAQELTGMLRESLIWPALFDPSYALPPNRDEVISEAVRTLIARYAL